MGTVTVTLDQSTTHASDHERQMTGTLVCSNSLAAGGDTTTVGAFGLGILTDLDMQGALGNYVVVDTLPLVGAATVVHIAAYVANVTGGSTAINTIGTGLDFSGDTVRFRAHGA